MSNGKEKIRDSDRTIIRRRTDKEKDGGQYETGTNG